jgi:hypothetical protein
MKSTVLQQIFVALENEVGSAVPSIEEWSILDI